MTNNKNQSGAVEVLKKLRAQNKQGLEPSINKYLNKNSSRKNSDTHNEFTIIEIDTDKITRWEHKDRPKKELGNIGDLAKTFKDIGQQQPCIARPSPSKDGQYEIIVGERRWKAAQSLGYKLKVIIQDLNDKEASLIQAVENEKRKDLSDYAKGMSYHNKITAGILKQSDLINILGISKQQISRLLSFSKIHPKVKEAISDFSNISARTAEEIKRLSNKDDRHINALISLSEKIKLGGIGAAKINSEVNKIIRQDKKTKDLNTKILSKNGRHLFSWRKDNNENTSIHFPKDISELIKHKKININDLSKELGDTIEKYLQKID